MKVVVFHTQTQVDALRECTDLVLNGYNEMFHVKTARWWYFKYRHANNGRILVVEWKPDRYQIKERSLILKSVGHLVDQHCM